MNNGKDMEEREQEKEREKPVKAASQEGEGTEARKEGASIEELPAEKIERLSAELAAKTREAEDHYNMFLRACADLDNYRKRMQREKAEIVSHANENLVKEFLPVIDNLQRALEHTDGGPNNIESLKEGIRLTVEHMFSVLKKFGLEEIKADGEKFDPSLHHAISHEEGEGAGPEIVVKVFQKGYLLKGRLLRPSMVAVARTPREPS